MNRKELEDILGYSTIYGCENCQRLHNERRKKAAEALMLLEENEQLKQQLVNMGAGKTGWAEVIRLKKENVRLKNMLKSCDPFTINPESECDACGQGVGEITCVFCGNSVDEGHTEVCEYVKEVKSK